MTILFDLMLRVARGVSEDVLEGSATSGSAITLADAVGAILDDNDFWNSGTLFFKSGALANHTANISDFVKTTGLFTFYALNLVTNPGAETDTTGYAASGAGVTIARVTTQYQHGVASIEVTTATGVASAVLYSVALVAGVEYTFSVDVLDVNAQSFHLEVSDVHAVIETGANWTGTGAWVRKSITFTPDESEIHGLWVVRNAVAATDKFYADGFQCLAGTGAVYLQIGGGDQYLALSPAWPRSRLIQAINTALQKQDVITESEATAVVADQVEYALTSGISRLLRVFVGNDTDGWVEHFHWKEEGATLRFYAHEPGTSGDYIRIQYLAKPTYANADSTTLAVDVNDDLAVFDALAELWLQRSVKADENPRAKARFEYYQAEAERLRRQTPKPVAAPRYSGVWL